VTLTGEVDSLAERNTVEWAAWSAPGVKKVVDNLVVLLVPGAMEAGLDSVLFWASLAVGFAVAFVATFPVNRWLIVRGRGHALAHGGHS